MRLLFVAHNFIYGNGQGRINLEVVRGALAQGKQVTLIADRVDEELIDLGAKVIGVRQVPKRPNLLGVRSFAFSANRVTRRLRDQHDLVVATGYTLTEPHDVNLCQFVHGAWIESPVHVSKLRRGPNAWYQGLYTRANARWEKLAYRQARFVVPPSQKIERELIAIGVNPASIRVIYNGVDLSEFRPRTDELRSTWGLPDNVLLGLFAGDIRTPRKNLDTVLKAMARLPGVHLAVVGALDQSPFPAMAKSLGVYERVHFLGFRKDISQIMRIADVFIFPSRYEAGTLVLIEAAASGLPLITARTAGGCEMFDSESATILEDPNDEVGLAEAISVSISKPERRKSASAAARATAERHSWEKMADQYLHLFEECVRSGNHA